MTEMRTTETTTEAQTASADIHTDEKSSVGTWLPVFGVAVSAVCLLLAAPTLRSVVVVTAVIAIWRWFARPLAFALGTVGIATTVQLWSPLGAVAAAGLWTLLVPSSPVTSVWRELGWLAVATLSLGTLTVLTLESEVSLFAVALAVATLSGLACYGLHRYEKVRLGLVTDHTEL